MLRKCMVYIFVLTMLGTACGENKQEKETEERKSEQQVAEAGKTAIKRIVFFGNSLTAGYGLDAAEAFPALIQLKLDSMQLPYQVVNAGLSGETTAGGNSRVEWILNQPMDIFILELGGNDGLRGIPIKESSKNLQEIIDQVWEKYPDVKIILAGMQVPPNMGQQYSKDFREMFETVAQKNNIPLIPFLLEGVGGVPELNLPDGIHPTAEGHKIVAENIWEVLKPEL